MAFDFKSVLARAERTQPTAQIVPLRKSDLNAIADEIDQARNELVIWEGAFAKFEIQVEDERCRLLTELNKARDVLKEKTTAFDAAVDSRGLRTVVKPVVVERE